jgi:hypothetical protein
LRRDFERVLDALSGNRGYARASLVLEVFEINFAGFPKQGNPGLKREIIEEFFSLSLSDRETESYPRRQCRNACFCGGVKIPSRHSKTLPSIDDNVNRIRCIYSRQRC